MKRFKILTTTMAVSFALLGSGDLRAEEAAPSRDANSQSLFNGRNLQGWHADVPDLDANPDGQSPFVVRDGLLVSLGNPGGHLITDAVYQNYQQSITQSGGFASGFADLQLEEMASELRECEAIETIPAATAGLLALLEHPRMSRLEDAQRAPLETGDVVAVLTSGVVTQ